MLYNSSLITELKKVLGWEDSDDPEIPALGSPLNDTEIGEYYQDFHPAVRLDYIKAILPTYKTLTDFLDEAENKSIRKLLKKIETKRNLTGTGSTLTQNDVIYDVGNKKQTITNEGRFCGVMFSLLGTTGLSAVINRVGLYLTSAVTDLDIYLFHSSQEQAISTYQFTTAKNNSFSWQEIRIQMQYDIASSGISSGTWYVGYYQDDLALQSTQAVRYTAINWELGYCYTCDKGVKQSKYLPIRERLYMQGFYVPAASLPVSKSEKFDNDVVIGQNNNNFGFNFNISIGCDLTQFWIDNRRDLANCIGMSVAMFILDKMKFSSQINHIEEGLKGMIVRDLEGTVDTGQQPMWKRLDNAIDALRFDEGSLNKECIPHARPPRGRVTNVG